jgi:DNA-binding CsgD family transcriptional regulator
VDLGYTRGGISMSHLKNVNNELVQLQRTLFWQSVKSIKSDRWEELDEVYYQLPSGHMHVHDAVNMGILYSDPEIRKNFGLNRDNIQSVYNAELKKRVDPPNYQRNVEYTVDFVTRGNKYEIGVMFQHMNMEPDPEAELEWYVTFMKYCDNAKGLFTLDFKVRFLDRYQNKFMRLIALDEFVHKNLDKFQDLTPREIEIMTDLANGYSNQEISDEFHIAKYTVDTHRKNIMNKLGIRRFVDLIRFAEAFDLV